MSLSIRFPVLVVGGTLLATALAPLGGMMPRAGEDGAGGMPRGHRLAAQVPDRPVGTVATGLLLRRLDGVKRVLMIAAHPDDEDTAFLAQMARGLGAETAYLSLTRGDGGQNLIGPELFEGLGVVRTGELDAARGLDGGLQFFTRAFDFGFSKTGDEALTLWPREELLRDVVWTIRSFRPHVIVSVFAGTPADGHGQHQAAGMIAREAFDAAADPGRFPEQFGHGVEPWGASKFYRTSHRRFVPGAPPEDGEVEVPVGAFDALLAGSSHQLAMASRSQHRSQDMGAGQDPGPQSTSVVLQASRVVGGSDGVFAGVDTTLAGVAARAPASVRARVTAELAAYRTAVERARGASGPESAPVLPALLEAAGALDRARAALDGVRGSVDRELTDVLRHKRALVAEAVMAASGVLFDVRAARSVVVPGTPVEVEALLWNGGGWDVIAPDVNLEGPGWTVVPLGTDGLIEARVPAGTLATWRFRVEVPADAEPSRLYFLREERDGAMYRWPEDPRVWGRSRDADPVVGRVGFRMAGPGGEVPIDAHAPWRYVGVDQALGEFVEPVLVLPALSVRVAPEGMVWPTGRLEPRPVTVVVSTEVEGGRRGVVRLDAPPGWTASPGEQRFELEGAGAERSLVFDVGPSGPPEAGSYRIGAVAEVDDGTVYHEGYALVDYDHIERAVMFRTAESDVAVVPVRTRDGMRVGYIMGTGDDGPEAIRQMGASVELLDASRVRSGDFMDFDVLVLGIRAYEARPDVRAANAQILDFARAGGVVVNQYNQYQFSEGGYAPHALEIGRPAPRVSVETQPVRLLHPDAPVFLGPNALTAADFEGWVQERGLYFASIWSDAYLPLLEMNDPGEEPARGSLLVAEVGEGLYVYAALSFFRQWSGQVPGAYRLFANLISLDPVAWRAFRDR